MLPWRAIARAQAPDGTEIELRQRGGEFLIRAGGRDLMSSEDEVSSQALAEIGCAGIGGREDARVLVGGLGMGFTLAEALGRVGKGATVEVAELVDAVVEWNRGPLADLAGRPLEDPRTKVLVEDVAKVIEGGRARYDAILLDVDNGPDALAHDRNERLYDERGLARAARALRPGGVLAVWSFSEDTGFERRLRKGGFTVAVERVPASRRGRGRYHVVFVGRR